MQNLIIYALATSTLGAVRDYANAKSMGLPAFTRGFGTNIKLRLFGNDGDNGAYPITAFTNVASWSCVWDKDYNNTTAPTIVADNDDIDVATVTDTINGQSYAFTEVTIPVSQMNTQAIIDFIGDKEQEGGLTMELIGYDSDNVELFGLQIKNFTMRNRVYVAS